MITSIEQMTHPLGIRFYKIQCDDFITGHIWSVVYKYRGCVVHCYAPNFNECARICKRAFGVEPSWIDCSTLSAVRSIKGLDAPETFSQFEEWIHSISNTLKDLG